MSFSSDFEQLAELHQRGLLSDAEFSRAKARLLGETAPGASRSARSHRRAEPEPGNGLGAAINRLQRSRDERWLGGVCGGLAQVSGLAPWIWRLIFLSLVFCHGVGLLSYLLLWLLVPVHKDLPRLAWNGSAQDPKN